MKDKRKDSCKAFQQTQVSPPTEHAVLFLKSEKFLPGSDDEFTEQPIGLSRYDEQILIKVKHIMEFGWSLTIEMLCFHSSSHMALHTNQKFASSIWRRYCRPELRRWMLEDPTSGNRGWRNESSLTENFWDHIILNIWLPNSLDCFLLDH